MDWIDNLRLWFGFPRIMRDYSNRECFKCKIKTRIIDLGDGDYVCKECWDNYIPGYAE